MSFEETVVNESYRKGVSDLVENTFLVWAQKLSSYGARNLALRHSK